MHINFWKQTFFKYKKLHICFLFMESKKAFQDNSEQHFSWYSQLGQSKQLMFLYSTILPYVTHRMIEWFELEGNLKPIQLQPPCLVQSCQPPNQALDEVAKVPIQPGLKHFQGWGQPTAFLDKNRHLP